MLTPDQKTIPYQTIVNSLTGILTNKVNVFYKFFKTIRLLCLLRRFKSQMQKIIMILNYNKSQ